MQSRITLKQKFLMALALTVFLLVGCKTETQMTKTAPEGLDKLGIVTVVSREDGSGTRSAFAQMLDFDDAANTLQSDRTTENAIIVRSTDEVIAKVAESSSAIGYISMGASGSLNNGKILRVDEKEPSQENVNKGKYPLSRSFYLAYSGKLDELQRDFLSYVRGKGQTIVAQSYVAIGKSQNFLSNQANGTLKIHGSTSVGPLMEQLAAEYMRYNTHARIVVVQSDSTQGLTDAMQGKCNFAMSSRDLKDYEKELLDYNIIAKDGIEVIVNADNPLKNISAETLRAIYTGDITRWDELK